MKWVFYDREKTARSKDHFVSLKGCYLNKRYDKILVTQDEKDLIYDR